MRAEYGFSCGADCRRCVAELADVRAAHKLSVLATTSLQYILPHRKCQRLIVAMLLLRKASQQCIDFVEEDAPAISKFRDINSGSTSQDSKQPELSIGDFMYKFVCDTSGCSGMRVPQYKRPGLLRCNRCGDLRAAKSLATVSAPV